MRIRILPAVLSIYREEASKLGAPMTPVLPKPDRCSCLSSRAVLFCLMVGVQLWLAGRTHRILNLGWLVATITIVAVAALVGTAIASNSHHLRAARQRGSDPAAQLSSARILAVRAQADESLSLIARGSGATFSQDFDEVAARLGGGNHPGLAEQVQRTLRSLGRAGTANQLDAELSLFFQQHQTILNLQDKGDFPGAIENTSKREAPHLVAAVEVLDKEIDASQERFTASIRRGSFDAPVLYSVVALGAILICASIGAGIYPRLREYR